MGPSTSSSIACASPPPPAPSCLRKPTSSTPSPTLPSSSSRRPLASWTLTRMDFCPPPTTSLPSALPERTLVVERHRLCSTRWTSVPLRPRRCLRRLRKEHCWWRGTGYARRGGRTHELHPDGHPLRLQDGRWIRR